MTPGTPRHSQVPVKINAWADEGVASLVEAVSAFPDLQTIESCQGGEQDTPNAYVIFLRGRNWQENGAFLEWLSTQVGKRSPDLMGWRLSIEWSNGGTNAWARCSVVPTQMEALAAELRTLAGPPWRVDETAATVAHHLAVVSRFGFATVPGPEEELELLPVVGAPTSGMRRTTVFEVLSNALTLATSSLKNGFFDRWIKRHLRFLPDGVLPRFSPSLSRTYSARNPSVPSISLP